MRVTLFLYQRDRVFLSECVCVCVREREREREKVRVREKDNRQRSVLVPVRLICLR